MGQHSYYYKTLICFKFINKPMAHGMGLLAPKRSQDQQAGMSGKRGNS